MSDTVDEVLPLRREGLDRDAVAALYGRPGEASGAPWVRVNFVATLDGSATDAEGLSGGISSASDKLVFGVLRRLADVVLVAAGTVRREGYEGPLVSARQRAWRLDHGLAEHPGLAIVSGSLDLDLRSPVFTASPVRPVVLAPASADPARRAALAAVADVLDFGADAIDPAALRSQFAARGWMDVLCEGGPSLFGALAAAGAVDELCLTLAPRLVSGAGARIASGPAADVAMRLAHVLRGSADEVILRYVR